jgi:DNA primase
VPNDPWRFFGTATSATTYVVGRSDDVSRLQREVSLERMVRGRGVKLRGHGGDLTGVCPFHSRSRPRLVIDRKANTWSCGCCKVSNGTVVDWTAKAEGVSRKHAVELLRADHAVVGTGNSVKKSSIKRMAGVLDQAADDAKLLSQVVGYYHGRLKANAAALAFLQKHGVTGEAVDRLQVGFSDRTIGYAVPDKNRVAGAEIRGRLQQLGILKDTGHETLRGCVTIPVFDAGGAIVSLYGRRVDPVGDTDLFVGKVGLWNRETFTATRDVVVAASPFEALVLWSAGARNVTAVHGLDGPVDELLAAVEAHRMTRVTLVFPRTAQGDDATKTIMDRLVGVEVFRALLPTGMDVPAFVASASTEAVVGSVRTAEWIGGVRPPTEPAHPKIVVEGSPESAGLVTPTGTHGDEIVFEHGDRKWRVRGLSGNTSYERLRVHVFVSRETRDARTSGFHVDTLDLYSARQRQAFVTQATEELGMGTDTLKRDLGHVLLRLEAMQDGQIRAALETKSKTPPMTEAERAAALDLLRDPKLIDRILSDFDRCGVVGEADNKLVGYLAATSRRLRHPLAITIQSSSAAGKSSLMDAILDFVPPEDRLSFSAMTGQSLYYMGETDIGHKVLSIAEQDGAERASYALKVLQSEGQLTIASTGKEPGTGRLVSHEYRVRGPVSIFTTTTAIDVDEELLSRCIVLTVDERPEQTRAIHERQRHAQTLDGLFATGERERVLHVHRNAQRLLRPLGVVNPFVSKLTFDDHRVRARRDHRKVLGLIEALAFLHQHQRTIKVAEREGITVEYVEVAQDDLAVANRLTAAVVSRGSGDLPPMTRRVLDTLDMMVRETAGKGGLELRDVRFSRREARQRLGLGGTQAWTHVRRLIDGEYLIVHPSRRGRGVVYELALEDAGTISNSGPTGAYSGVRSGDIRPPIKSTISEKKAATAHRSGLGGSQDRPPSAVSGRSANGAKA